MRSPNGRSPSEGRRWDGADGRRAVDLPEYPLDAVEGLKHVTLLVDRFGAFADHVRESIDRADELGDKCTSDLYTEVGRDVDKRLWFLEAHVQDRE